MFSVTTIAVASLMMVQGIYMHQNQHPLDPRVIRSMVVSTNSFAMDMYRHLSDSGENIIYSPFSITSALLMTMLGTKGASRNQIISRLHLDTAIPEANIHAAFEGMSQLMQRSHGKYAFNVASRLYTHNKYHFLEDFLTKTNQYYHASAQEVDFGKSETARDINTWVATQTGQKIQNLLPPNAISALTRLVLVNAVYFKGTWATQFNPKDTHEGHFNVSPTERIVCNMMSRKGKFNAAFSKEHNITILELPYSGKEVSMILLLPDKDNELRSLEKTFSVKMLQALRNELWNMSLIVTMPKFKLTEAYKLSKVLKDLGVKNIFDSSKADLSGMDGTKNLYISEGYHKAFIDVNEEGTEAAAATAMVASFRAMPAESKRIDFNRAFLFLIFDNRTESILFMGRVKRPPAVQKQKNEL